MSMTAANVYGTPRSTQPTNTAAPSPEPGSNIRTEQRMPGIAGNPVSWLVALVGIAILLIVSVRLEVEVAA